MGDGYRDPNNSSTIIWVRMAIMRQILFYGFGSLILYTFFLLFYKNSGKR
jgi:hypothetical protein